MIPSGRTQSDEDKAADRVYAAMETGNQGQARTLLRELKELSPSTYESVQVAVVKDYGVSL